MRFFLTLCIQLFFCTSIYAADFVYRYNGATLAYEIISAKERTVGVVREHYHYRNVIIPNHVEYGGNTYSVTQISDWAFKDCKELESLVIPSTVIYIGLDAFHKCANLVCTIPSSVTKISMRAFGGCKKIYCELQTRPSEWDINWNRNGNKKTEVVWGHSIAEKDAASKNATTEKQEITKSLTGKPPRLDIIPESVQFVDPTDNYAIDANETCIVRFKVKNNGQGDGEGCSATIKVIEGSSQGLGFRPKPLPTISIGSTLNVDVLIIAGINTIEGKVTLSVEVDEPHGFGSDPIQLTVNTKAFEEPLVKVVDYVVTGSNGATIAKREEFNLQLLVQNTKHGVTDYVEAKIELPQNVFMMTGNERSYIGTLTAGEQKLLSYSLIVNNNYASDEIPIKVLLSEKYGKYAENKTITLKLNQTLASNALVINEKVQQKQQINIGALGSDIDKDIPQTNFDNSKTFVIIIANENYQSVAEVPFARNDGETFKQYCIKTLGIPEQNIRHSSNATLNNIKTYINWLKQVVDAYGEDTRVIFYYAGHGIPDEADRTAYLLPIDGYGNDVSTGYKLDDLYSTLGKLSSKTVTVFLDACFSGSNRDGQMLASARGVAIKAKSSAPVGNMVVFSAAQGNETAYPNNEQMHGMFTYYLLKKIKETNGDITYKELGDYVIDKVCKQSILVNHKSQTPVVVPSATVGGNWESWKLK